VIARPERLDFRRYRPKPGHPDWDACHDEACELAAEIAPLITTDADLTVRDRLRDARRKTRSLVQTAGNLMINRRRYRRGDHALRPLYVIWTMLNDCNFRCTYCDNHQGEQYFDIPDPERLDTEQGKRLLDVMITGTPAIYWCGGEPTMRADLPELLDHAWNAGYFPNMINTNGSLLHNRLQKPGWKNFLWQMDIVIVSLDGLQLDRLNELWGVNKARQVVVNILMLRELSRQIGFKLSVNTVITPENIDEARDVLALMSDLDLWFVPVPVNHKHEPNRALLDDPSYCELAELILERRRQGQKIIGSPTLLRRLLHAEPYECLTALKPHVWSNGEICWPCRASINVPPVNIDLLEHDSFDAAYAAGRRRINPDRFHGPASNQCGGSCAWMQNYTTARYGDALRDPLGSGIVPEIFDFAFSGRSGRR